MSDNLLKQRDYTIILAKNAVQNLGKPPGLEQQWQKAEKSIINLAKKCEELDPDGITLYIASTPFQKYEGVNSEILTQIFQQDYAVQTLNLVDILKVVIENYFKHKTEGTQKANGEIIIIVLDSEPENRRSIIKLLVEATQKINSRQELGIMFAQVGDDVIARGFLNTLDDDLHRAGAKLDIVDTKVLGEIEAKDIPNFLLNALFD